MKKITVFFITLLFVTTGISQVTNEGQPLSWKLLNDASTFTSNTLPSFDLKAIKAEDKINDYTFNMPWRFGFMHSVDYGFEEGKWTVLDNGDRIWRIKIHSEKALSLNVIFDDFYLPEGGKVYLYNDDRSDLLGAYTAAQNQESGILGTWLVKGKTLWIEYLEPANVANQGRLHIAKATHGYRNAQTFNESKGLNDSGDCNLDVDCPIGADWQEHKDNNKKASGILLSGGSGFCSGALVNNTNNDGKPYFLTANHCFSNPAAWAFRFGWISPDPVCAASTNSTDSPTNLTLSGATLRARNAASDFCLVEINTAIPANWDITWSGWDRSETTPDFVVGIHHPSGDIMKVCRDDSGVTQEVNGGAQTWEITDAGDGWELGVTEPGSSGSPLYDQNGRIIGQLYGGLAACSGTVDNDRYDYYGRFGVSWDTGSTAATRLMEWLDPAGTNPDILDSYPPLEVFNLDASISVTIPSVDCGTTEVMPYLTLRNSGLDPLTSATITWSLDGNTNPEINWTGSLAQNETEQIDLGAMTLPVGIHEIIAEVSDPNGATDENTTNNIGSASIEFTLYNTTQVHLDLLTDDYAEETTWEFRDEAGTVLYSGGPYQETVDDNTHFLESFNVSLNECYVFEIFDTEGDGICCGFGIGSYELTTDDDTVIFSGGEFGDSEQTEIPIGESLGLNDNLDSNVSVYPNPTTDVINIDFVNMENEYKLEIFNLLGQTVRFKNLDGRNNSINISSLTAGVYFVKIKDLNNNEFITKKVIIK